MKLLALVEAPDHVCCRYRVRAFERALESAGCSLHCEGLDRGAFFRVIQLKRAQSFDAVILQRKLLASWQLKALRRASRRLVFDFDDAVMLRDSYSGAGGKAFPGRGVSRRRCVRPTRLSPEMTSWRTRRFEPGRASSACM